MVVVHPPPPPNVAPPLPKGPPAEPPLDVPPPEIPDVPGVTSMAVLGALLVGAIVTHFGVATVWKTVFTNPVHWFGRVFRHFIPHPEPLRKQISQDVTSTFTRMLAANSPRIARWLHKEAHVIEQGTGVIVAMAQWTYEALRELRHVTIPHLIYNATHPLYLAANALDARLTPVETRMANATAYVNTMLRRLPWGTGATFDQAERQWAGAFGHLWDQSFTYMQPKLNRLYDVRVPALERAVTRIQTYDDYLRTQALPDIRGRISWLERNLTGILSDAPGWVYAAIGLGLAPALGVGAVRAGFGNLFCRNTQNVANKICAADAQSIERLIAMTLGFAILLDPAAVLRAGQAAEGAIDGVIREMAGV